MTVIRLSPLRILPSKIIKSRHNIYIQNPFFQFCDSTHFDLFLNSIMHMILNPFIVKNIN